MDAVGDRNTAFFHASCSERKRRNRIGRLRSEAGGWIEDEVEKRSHITNYFSNLFRTAGSHDTNRLLGCVQRKVSNQMNEDLMKEYSREEVETALKSIGNLKALGPDGMPALFYKDY